MQIIVLTHRDHVCFSVVHLAIVFIGPHKTFVNPGLEAWVLVSEQLPSRHKELEGRDSTSQNGVFLSSHHHLYLVRDLDIIIRIAHVIINKFYTSSTI